MYAARVDMEILTTDEIKELRDEYERRFGKDLLFNYTDFGRIGERCAAQVYMDIIKQCLEENKPYEVESEWCKPGSLIDH